MQFLDPKKVLQHFSIMPGMQVAELHAGSGHFTPLIREEVGEYGLVHSLQHAHDADPFELSEPVDRVLVINVPIDAHHHSVFSRAYRMLKPQGRMILIERANAHLMPELATDLAGMAGLIRERHFHAGEHHFGIVFKRI